MTTPSHTELAARLREAHDLSLDGLHQYARIAILEVAAALESPERVLGEACSICFADEPYTGTCGSNDPRALCNLVPTPPTAPAQDAQGEMVLVPRKLPRHARMYLLGGEKSWATLLGLIATPSPQAEKQPLSLSELAVHQAVQMIADWPITDKKNMDAMNMQGIAVAALKVGIVTKEST